MCAHRLQSEKKKNMQNWRKGCLFGHVHKFWKEHDRKIEKKSIVLYCIVHVSEFEYLHGGGIFKLVHKEDDGSLKPVFPLRIWAWANFATFHPFGEFLHQNDSFYAENLLN